MSAQSKTPPTPALPLAILIQAVEALHKKFTGNVIDAGRMFRTGAYPKSTTMFKTPPHEMQASGLLSRLPRELRDQIYALVLTEQDRPYVLNTLLPPALARVNRQLRAECLPIFLRTNHFHVVFANEADRFGVKLAPVTLNWLKAAGFTAPVFDHVSFSPPESALGGFTTFPMPVGSASSLADGIFPPMLHVRYNSQSKHVHFTHGGHGCQICGNNIPHRFEQTISGVLYAFTSLEDVEDATEQHRPFMGLMNDFCGRAFGQEGISVRGLDRLASCMTTECMQAVLDRAVEYHYIDVMCRSLRGGPQGQESAVDNLCLCIAVFTLV